MSIVGVKVVEVPEIIEFVLQNPSVYPGKHASAQPRTSEGLPLIDPSRQLRVIWDATVLYIQEQLETGKSVYIKNFGAFTYEPIVSEIGNPRNYRAATLRLRPCFVADPVLKESLYRYPGKQEVPPREGSVYQLGMKMGRLNTAPIAAGSYFKEDVVRQSLGAIFHAIADLSARGYNLNLNFKFCRLRIIKRNVKVDFSTSFTLRLQDPAKEWPSATMAAAHTKGAPISEMWTKNHESQVMSTYMARPDSTKRRDKVTRTQQLATMSLDMNSCMATKSSKPVATAPPAPLLKEMPAVA